MATESVSGFYLPFDEMNQAGALLEQARGIASCVGMAADREDEMPDGAVSSACWAIRDLLDQVEKITSLRRAGQ